MYLQVVTGYCRTSIKDTTLPSTVPPATFCSFLLLLEIVNLSPTDLLYSSRFFSHAAYQNHNLFHSPTLQHSQIHFSTCQNAIQLACISHCIDFQFCIRQTAIQLTCNLPLHRFPILHSPNCNSAGLHLSLHRFTLLHSPNCNSAGL